MADSDTPPPSSARPGPERESPGRDPAGSKGVDARVRQQRRHIEGLDGRDPLRPGIDD
jgi:hypothetical protein